MLVAAAGDLLVLCILRGVPPGAWVQDHPREVGCLIVAVKEVSPPTSVSEADLPSRTKTDSEELSLFYVSALVLLSFTCATLGFLLALM